MTVKFIFLALSLIASRSCMAMEIEEKPEKTVTPPSPTEILEAYVKENGTENGTVLVPTKYVKDTIIHVQKLKDSLSINANIEEFIKAIQTGAKLAYTIAHSKPEEIAELAQKINAADVPSIIKYLYSQSCTIRPDKTGFTEGILIVTRNNPYFTGLKMFFEKYQERVLKGNATQKSSTIPLIKPAKTAGAFRLMCMTITETNQEKMAPFLDKFEDFHIILSDENIRIKPEREAKNSNPLQLLKIKLKATPNAGPEYNKTTDIPSELINTFWRTFPNAKVKNATIGGMYTHILNELKIATAQEKHDILKCKGIFEKIAAINGLSHLSDRIGQEIILGEEELFESYFSEKNCTEQTTSWKEACGIYLLFKQVRDTIRAYISEEKSLTTENSVRADIEHLYAVVNSKALESISEPTIRTYLYNTAITLKYLATIQETPLPNKPAITLKERLMGSVFERTYQANLDIKTIAEGFIVQQDAEKFEKLDKLLAGVITNFWKTHQEKFTKKYPLELPKNALLGKLIVNQENSLFETNNDIYSKTLPPYAKLAQIAQDLENFKQTHTLLTTCTQHLLGTTILATQDKSEWNRNALKTDIDNLSKDLKVMLSNLAKTVENNGCYCSAGEQGKKIIAQTCTELFKSPSDKKDPETIKKFKKSAQVFASIPALQKATQSRINQQKEFDIFKNLK